MSLTAKYTNDAFPSDQEFGLEGVGVFVNGQAREVTEDEERAFVASNRTTFEEWVKDNESWEVSGSGYVTSVKDVLGVDPEEITNVTTDLQVAAEPALTVVHDSSGTLDLGGEE